jgi:hypothetical protein
MKRRLHVRSKNLDEFKLRGIILLHLLHLFCLDCLLNVFVGVDRCSLNASDN